MIIARNTLPSINAKCVCYIPATYIIINQQIQNMKKEMTIAIAQMSLFF